MDDRFHVRLGDDEIIRAFQEFDDFRCRRDGVLAETQHAHFGVREDTKAGALAAFDGRLRALAGIGIFAHAEEGEIVGAQPVEEGERFFLFAALAVLRANAFDGLVERRHHLAPVAHGQVNLLQNIFDAFDERLAGFRQNPRQMDLNVADAAFRGAAVIADMKTGLLALFHDQDRMDHHEDVAVGAGQFAHDGVEQEGHVAIGN